MYLHVTIHVELQSAKPYRALTNYSCRWPAVGRSYERAALSEQQQCHCKGIVGCCTLCDLGSRNATFLEYVCLRPQDYPFARGASDFDVPLPPAALWRSQVDHFCIFRNLHETLPPKCAEGRVVPVGAFSSVDKQSAG